MEIKNIVSLKCLNLVSWDVPSFYIPEMAFLRSSFDHAQSLPPSLPLQCVELVQIFPICQCGDDVILGLDTTNSCVYVSEVCEGSVISQEIFCRGYSLKK